MLGQPTEAVVHVYSTCVWILRRVVYISAYSIHINHTTYIFSMGATVQMECNIRRYCTVILHVAKANIALLIETMYIVRLKINSMVESAIWD